MTEITQADRDAVKAYYVETGFVADQKGLEQAFARHRMEERAAIVAALHELPASVWDKIWESCSNFFIPDAITEEGIKQVIGVIADRIKAGEHLK